MKRILLFILISSLYFSAKSFHIVGGEITFETIRPGLYRVVLIQYYDEAQTSNNNYDPEARVHMFSNQDNSLQAIITLPRRRITNVPYTNIKCVIDELQTSRVEYSLEFSLDPEDFADPEGYYLSWERCCRNLGIVNLVNPTAAGMNYLIEIPPLFKDDAPFVNSSPNMFSPLRDYACLDKFYYVNFSGQDRDGDSLSYEIVTPLNSSSNIALPIPQPKPHVPVRFAPGFSEDISIKGNPPLEISDIGLLTVSPVETGLFVFSVLIKEWRNGEQIGSVQRDFQMLVVDGCSPPDPPEVGIRVPGRPDFDPEVDVLSYAAADEKCFEFFATNIDEGEEVFFKAELPGSFQGLEGLFEITSTLVGTDEDTLWVEVCAPDCPPILDGPFSLDLIAGDDECPLPQLDTATVTFLIEPPANEFPVISPGDNSFFVSEDDQFDLLISAIDVDGDSMDMFLVVDGLADPETAGFTLEVTTNTAGQVEGLLKWDTDCLVYDFGENQQFDVRVFVDDRDTCMVMNPEHLFLSMNVLLPPNTPPNVSTPQTSFEINSNELLTFPVSVSDSDGDSVSLMMSTPDFDAAALGISFGNTSGIGSTLSEFSWDIDCASFIEAEIDQFEIFFIGDDIDKCKVRNADTLVVNIDIGFANNQPPLFQEYESNLLKVGETIVLEISATDPNTEDVLSLEYLDDLGLSDTPGWSFEPVTGQGTVSSTLSWIPQCDLLDLQTLSGSVDLKFEVSDNGCPEPARDTLVLTFDLFDDPFSFDQFMPPNVFSPNGDGYNDHFTLANLPDPAMNLPEGNCQNAFEYFSIIDRNGKTVFNATNRDFSWNGGNAPAGVYFYLVKYTKQEFKGPLKLLR